VDACTQPSVSKLENNTHVIMKLVVIVWRCISSLHCLRFEDS